MIDKNSMRRVDKIFTSRDLFEQRRKASQQKPEVAKPVLKMDIKDVKIVTSQDVQYEKQGATPGVVVHQDEPQRFINVSVEPVLTGSEVAAPDHPQQVLKEKKIEEMKAHVAKKMAEPINAKSPEPKKKEEVKEVKPKAKRGGRRKHA